MSPLVTNSKKPIGKTFIEAEINAHRDLLSIYSGYCNDLEKYFGCQGILWGRSYKILINPTVEITIHEIFSPTLVKDFKLYK